ncbi:MAG TPA: AbgT family transporter [Pirellulaceae bacterium]|nr:AbgT family transporter [Pirellulaceae bacterium]HMO94230.1 AbgT family transporter [Pirellulaceae bacterium]HMP71266.1 AbgT family transporter [Pirellulaceae bacterium]
MGENKLKRERGLIDGFLGFVERVGNLLPHPVMLFAYLALFTILLSGIGAHFDWSVVDPRPESAPGRSPDGMVRVESLMSGEGLRRITTELVNNFVKFAPLGTVLVALLGVGVAEHSGLISAAIRLLILGAPKFLVTAALVFAGVVSNTASEIGYVVIVPLGAAIYFSLNRHPLAGLAAAFAGVSGGYSANLLLGTIDPLLSGITSKAAESFDPSYVTNPVSPACNLYFMMVSTFVVTALGTFVSMFIVEPRLGNYSASEGDQNELAEQNKMDALTDLEKRGLIATAISIAGLTLVLLYLCVPIGAFEHWLGVELKILPWLGALAEPVAGKSTPSFLTGIVALIFVGFLIPGIVYGAVVGTIRKDIDVLNSMSKSMSSMGMYIVLVFFAAQFVEFFNWSNLGTLLAIKGGELVRYLKLDNPLIFVFFIFLCAVVNLFMGSASAKWTFMAPIFVPMMMDIGYSPEVVQLAYRIGDSCTNVIAPAMSYFGMIFVFALKYKRDYRLGSLISLMLPYSIVFFIGWTLFFYLWVFLLGFPIGPMAPIVYPASPAGV